MDSNNNLYELDLNSFNWSKMEVDPESSLPEARDDHSYCYDQENEAMYIFGGYVGGGKSNDLWKFNIIEKKWTQLQENEEEVVQVKKHSIH